MIGEERRMTTRNDRTAGRDDKSRAALARDAAISRIGRTRRWVIVGTAALTAGFAALVSAVAPGRSLASKSTGRASTTTAGTGAGASSSSSSVTAIPQFPPAANPSSLGLQSPNQPPQISARASRRPPRRRLPPRRRRPSRLLLSRRLSPVVAAAGSCRGARERAEWASPRNARRSKRSEAPR